MVVCVVHVVVVIMCRAGLVGAVCGPCFMPTYVVYVGCVGVDVVVAVVVYDGVVAGGPWLTPTYVVCGVCGCCRCCVCCGWPRACLCGVCC